MDWMMSNRKKGRIKERKKRGEGGRKKQTKSTNTGSDLCI
jgi:hypothetical protein